MNALYHRGIITSLPDQADSYLALYGFRMTEQYDDIVTLIRDPVPLILSPMSGLTWNLDHYPATHDGTRQLEHDLTQWGISEHDRMVLLLTHQERYGAVVAHLWMETQASPYPSPMETHNPHPSPMETHNPHPSPVEIG